MFSVMTKILRRHHGIDFLLQVLKRLFKTFLFLFRILGNMVDHLNPGFMQHSHPFCEAFGKHHPFKPRRCRPFQGAFGLLIRIKQFAAGHQFGQHHGHGLQNLHFLFGILPPGPVLNHQNPRHPASPEDWHPQKGMIGFLASFLPIDKFRVILGVCQAQWRACTRHMPHQPLANAQTGPVNGRGFQTFGGKQFKNFAAPQKIGGTHLGHHVRRNQTHHLVQAVLGGTGPGHDLM